MAWEFESKKVVGYGVMYRNTVGPYVMVQLFNNFEKCVEYLKDIYDTLSEDERRVSDFDQNKGTLNIGHSSHHNVRYKISQIIQKSYLV